ncbi:MAG: PqqD family protein [Candidatus Aminicenantes bacterium]|nr:PqqD family protein [Candidatus Aminicenantes bacterium]
MQDQKKGGMALTATPRINPAVVQREAPDGEVVLVNLDTAASLALNQTGFIIWKLVDGRRTVEQIIDAVREHFPNTPPEVVNDVIRLMETLAEDGFVGFEWTGNKKNRGVIKESAI